MRTFLAVPGDPDWAASVRRLRDDLKVRLPAASWTRPDSWHLTLRFLGEISEEAADRFAERIAPAASSVPAAALVASGPVVFPLRGRPRTLGVGFDEPAVEAALGGVARAAERAAREIGCEPQTRPFRAHVTLARLREPWPPSAIEDAVRAVSDWAFPSFAVRGVVLNSSRLDPAGAVHTPLREWAAAAEARA